MTEATEQHTPHECEVCAPLDDAVYTSLSPAERERLVEAIYRSEFGERGYFGRPECEEIVASLASSVLMIKVNAFHAGVIWKGPGHQAMLMLGDLREKVFRLSRSIYNGAPDPLQEYYDRGFGQWLQNKVDAILDGRV